MVWQDPQPINERYHAFFRREIASSPGNTCVSSYLFNSTGRLFTYLGFNYELRSAPSERSLFDGHLGAVQSLPP